MRLVILVYVSYLAPPYSFRIGDWTIVRSSPLVPIHFVASVSQSHRHAGREGGNLDHPPPPTVYAKQNRNVTMPLLRQEFNGGCSLLAISVIAAFMAIITIQFIGPENAIVSK